MAAAVSSLGNKDHLDEAGSSDNEAIGGKRSSVSATNHQMMCMMPSNSGSKRKKPESSTIMVGIPMAHRMSPQQM